MELAYFFMAVSAVAAVGIVYTFVISRRERHEAGMVK